MSEGKGEQPEEDGCENQGGVILGCWDHEKTPALIQDLEHSVNLVERKCLQMFGELIYYKKYLEKSGKEDFQLGVIKTKSKKTKNSHLFSGSEPDIAFRKNLINLQEVRQLFEEKFKAKLQNINKEIKEAAQKIGLKDNIILLHANDYMKSLNLETEAEAEKSFDEVETFLNSKTKSDTVIIEHGGEAEFSQITQNELELYQKLSKLSMKKTGRKMGSKGRKIKFLLKKKTPRVWQDFRKTESKKHKSRKKFKKMKRTTVPKRVVSRSPLDSLSTKYSQEKFNDTEIERMCKSLNDAICSKKSHGPADAPKEQSQTAAVEENKTLGAAIRKTVPFTACASTSRSHNIGLNLQQLLFLAKHGRKSNPKASAVVRIQNTEPQESVNSKKAETDTEKGYSISCPVQSKVSGFEKDEDSHEEHKEKVWISEQKRANFRKVRSKYTGTSPEGFMEYHKSTMSQYSNGRKSMIKSESKRAYAVGSKIMVSDCQRTDVFEVQGDNASGDCAFNEESGRPRIEWTKAYNSFLDMHKRYNSLKGKLNNNHLAQADGELESLEKELDYSIDKYKDFLQFYSKFLHLNQRLKSLKFACQSKMLDPTASFSSTFQRKLSSFRPTHSSTLRKALREVQALQEKIRLINV